MSTVGAPVTVKILDPRDDDGQPLDNTNSSAVITITSINGADIYVNGAPMVWDVPTLRWEYRWDTTGVPAGRYRATVDLQPTGCPATPRFLEIDLQSPPTSDMALRSGPCDPWDAVLCCSTDGVDPVTVSRMVMAATEVYWGLSGRQFGVCTIPPLRPCRRSCFDGYGWNQWTGGNPFANGWGFPGWQQQFMGGGWWFDLPCGRDCGGDCSCTFVEEIALPSPVAEIVQVKLDGAVLAPSAYRVDNWNTLVRTDGGVWPICQDQNKNDTEVGTLSVTVKVGKQVPVLGELAVAELACVLIAGCKPDTECAIPSHLVAQTRAGNTQAFTAVSELVKEGLVGGEMGDLFLRTFNPSRLHSRSSVHSPDHRPARRAGT